MVGSIEAIAKLPRIQAMTLEIAANSNQRVTRNRRSVIPMSQEELEEMWDEIDDDSDYSYDDDEDDEPVRKHKKKKKKKSKKELTSADIEILNKQKARKKAQKERERAERLRVEEAEAQRKAERRRAKAKREAEIKIIQLIARRNYLKNKLDDMDPGKEKDARKIACMNIELREIEDQLTYLQSEYGIYNDKIDEGSRFGRFISKIKRKFNRAKKKTKKFFKDNKDLIVSLSAVILPFLGGCIVKMLVK